MGLKICLRPRWIPRNTSIVLKPHDLALAARILQGTASATEIVGKAVELVTHTSAAKIVDSSTRQTAGLILPTGQEGNNAMQTPRSWKKLTITLITILMALLQIFVQPGSMTPEHAATVIAGLIVACLIGLVYILTQGKVDIAKLTSSGAGESVEKYIEAKLADIIQPVVMKVDTLGQQMAGSTSDTTVATPTPVSLQAVQNADGTYTVTLPDGKVVQAVK
jgi:hypothetical protein